MRTELLIIDMQNDFCEPNGALFVTGATEDAKRVADMIRKHKSRIYDIHATLDTHHLLDIAHPLMWKNSVTGAHPNPFTLVLDYDANNNLFNAIEILNNSNPITIVTTRPTDMQRAIAYVLSLNARGRNMLCIWPPHCLIGSWGHNVQQDVYDALSEWESQFGFVNYVTKGSNMWTEHYSAVEADVPDPIDPTTSLNTSLIRTIQDADRILICGEASSHCVKFTIEDIANNFGEDNIKKFVYLEDASSPVSSFEQAAIDFVTKMTARGMQISRTSDVF
jgi:nicotinamidase/pyrazinamidase